MEGDAAAGYLQRCSVPHSCPPVIAVVFLIFFVYQKYVFTYYLMCLNYILFNVFKN
jgi:hypothetical protein